MGDGGKIMFDRKGALASLVRAVMAGEPDQFAPAARGAYAAGAHREELLCAIELGGSLGAVSPGVLAEAYAAAHAWSWMAARRRGSSSPLPARAGMTHDQ